jgi:hypothetical protein
MLRLVAADSDVMEPAPGGERTGTPRACTEFRRFRAMGRTKGTLP